MLSQASSDPFLSSGELEKWRKASNYDGDDDYLFPSVAKNGEQPIAPEMILRRQIRPALKKLGIPKRIGWHSFRHGLATMLRQNGVDVKTAQELLRHANCRITMDIYQPSVSEEKRMTQESAFGSFMKGVSVEHPSAPLDGV